jgi:hypothetical protein
VAFQPKEKRPCRCWDHRHKALIRDERGVETIAVAAAAKRDDSRGAEADRTAAPGAPAVSD